MRLQLLGIFLILLFCHTNAQKVAHFDDIYWTSEDVDTTAAAVIEEEYSATDIVLKPRIFKKATFSQNKQSLSPQQISDMLKSDIQLQGQFQKGYIRNERARTFLIGGLITLPIAIYGDAYIWERTTHKLSNSPGGGYTDHLGFIQPSNNVSITKQSSYAYVGTAISASLIITGVILKLSGTNKMRNTLEIYNDSPLAGDKTPLVEIAYQLQANSQLTHAQGLSLHLSCRF